MLAETVAKGKKAASLCLDSEQRLSGLDRENLEFTAIPLIITKSRSFNCVYCATYFVPGITLTFVRIPGLKRGISRLGMCFGDRSFASATKALIRTFNFWTGTN